MRTLGTTDRPASFGPVTFTNVLVLGVALVFTLSCSSSDDNGSFRATPASVVGDWHVDEGQVAQDTCQHGGAFNFPFDWRLTADGESISATDEQNCDPSVLGPIVDNKIVFGVFDDTIPLENCTVQVHRTQEIQFASGNVATLSFTEETTATGSACAELGHPDHCLYVYESPAARCDGCFECTVAATN